MKKVGVSQKAVVFNKEGKFLILHRTNTAPSNPNKWDFPGGELDFGENAIEGMIREVKEEAGLEVESIKPFDVESHINEKKEFWVTIAYITKSKFNKVKLSFEHDEFRWVSVKEFLLLESPEKLRYFIKNLNKI